MSLSQEKLRELYLKQENINDFKIGDVVRYVPERIAIQRKFRVESYMNNIKDLLDKRMIVKSITYDSFGECDTNPFHVMQHINSPNIDCVITSSCFFMYDRKTKIKKLLQEI